MSVLVLAEHDNASLKSATLHAVTAAQALGGDVDLLVVGHAAQPAVDAGAAIPGVARVLADNYQPDAQLGLIIVNTRWA